MLLCVLNVEGQPDIRTERLTALGFCNASGVVDVKRFVAFCLKPLKPGGPSHPSGGDMSGSSWTLSTAVIGEQTPLPSPEDQAGAVVVVNSK
eukprot:5439323-Amphidinium_carterae.1